MTLILSSFSSIGSAVYALLPDFEFAAVVCNMLKETYPRHFIAMPVEF